LPRPPPRLTPFPYTTLFRSKDAKMIPIGDASAAVAAFVQGKIDVLSYSSPVSNQAMREGDGVPLANIAAGDVPALNNYNSVVTVDRKSTRLNSSHVKISYAV